MATVRLDSDLPTLVDLLPKQAKVRRQVLQAIEKLVGPRRNEMITFRPGELARMVEIDGTSLAHALRELNELDVFTYIPPFRGRAIRMIQRDTPFDELEIDFEALDRRKAAEYEKLNLVIRFALSDSLPATGDPRLLRRRRRRGLRTLRQLRPPQHRRGGQRRQPEAQARAARRSLACASG